MESALSRMHDLSHFYKFLTREAAIKVLTNSSMKWSSPKLFNDPFDHRLQLIFPFNREKLINELNKAVERIVYKADIIIDNPTLLSAGMLRIRKIRDRFPKDKFLEYMNEAINETANRFPTVQAKLNSLYQDYLVNSRILCITETIDNIVMWSHYAEDHRGVALRLHCIDEIDNALLGARKVIYQTEFPSHLSVESYVRHQTGEMPMDMMSMIHELPFIKHIDWSYEKEWRIFFPLIHEPPKDGYDFSPEDRRVFGAAYLGCRMESEDEARILDTINSFMPHMEVFKAFPLDGAFGLRYEQIR